MDIYNTRADAVQFCIYEPGDRTYWISLYPGGFGRATLAPGAQTTWYPGNRAAVQVVFWVNGVKVGPSTVAPTAVTIDATSTILNAAPRPASAKEAIHHVVVLMLENRSFDNLLGWLYADTANRPPRNIPPSAAPTFDGLVEGRDWNTLPAAAHDTPGAQRVFVRRGVVDEPWYQQPTPNAKEEYPSFLEQMFATETPTDVMPANMHGFLANYAKSDPANPARIMASYSPEQLPVLNQLARNYAVCDRWFASVPCETWPNRSFVHAGSSFGRLNNGDALFEDNDPVPDLFAYSGKKTIFDVLDSHQVAWKVYHDSLLAPSLVSTQFWTLLQKLHYRAVPFAEFQHDAASGTLPAYSFIEPESALGANDQHPGPGCDMRRGEDLILRTWKALSDGPKWNNTLLVITYDEHGGCYDHVPPPATAVPPDTLPPQFTIPGFTPFRHFGGRVPAVVVSPWIEAGTVFRAGPGQQEYDHTSILATLRDWLFPAPRVPADWLPSARVAAATTLWPVLTRTTPRLDKPVLQSQWPGGTTALSCAGHDAGAVSRSADKLDVFHVDESGQVRTSAWEPDFADGWHGPWPVQALRFPAGASISVASRSTDKLDLFATDVDGAVRTAAWEPGGTWRGWWDVAGLRTVPGSTVTAASRNRDKLDIFVVDAGGAVVTAAWDAAAGPAWRGWWRVRDAVLPAGAPVHVVSRSPDKLDVFATDVNGVVRSAAWEPDFADGWHGWWEIAGGRAVPGAAVTAVSRSRDKLDIFVVGTDGRAWTAAWDPAVSPNWRGWWPIGDAHFPPGTTLHAVSRSADKIDLFGVDVGGVARTAAWEPAFGNTWHGWWEIAGGRARPGMPITAVSRSPDKRDLFMTGLDGRIWTAAWQPSFADGWHGWWPVG